MPRDVNIGHFVAPLRDGALGAAALRRQHYRKADATGSGGRDRRQRGRWGGAARTAAAPTAVTRTAAVARAAEAAGRQARVRAARRAASVAREQALAATAAPAWAAAPAARRDGAGTGGLAGSGGGGGAARSGDRRPGGSATSAAAPATAPAASCRAAAAAAARATGLRDCDTDADCKDATARFLCIGGECAGECRTARTASTGCCATAQRGRRVSSDLRARPPGAGTSA